MKKLLLALACVAIFGACKKESCDCEIPEEQKYCDLSQYVYAAPWYQVHRHEVFVYTNCTWKIAKSAEWIDIDLNYDNELHEGNKQFILKVEQNPKNTQRSAVITVTYFTEKDVTMSRRTTKLTIIQEPNPNAAP